MRNGIDSTATIYQIAYKLGARIQAKPKGEASWKSIACYGALADDTKYRVHPEDTALLDAAEAVFKQFHTEVEFRGYKYQVPNNAMDGKSPVLFIYGFGIYATVDKSGLVTEMSKEAADLADKSNDIFVYVVQSNDTAFGKKRKQD